MSNIAVFSAVTVIHSGHPSLTEWETSVDFRYACRMLSIALSTIAFFIAAYFIKRWLDEMSIPKSMTRSLVVFVAAAAVSYGVAFLVDWAIS